MSVATEFSPQNWVIKGGTLADYATFADLGIPAPRFSFRNLTASQVRFEMPVARATDDPVFPFGATISIKQRQAGGSYKQVFYGSIQSAPEIVIHGTEESLEFTAVDPWWHLEHIVFQQLWTLGFAGGPGSEFRSHLNLNTDLIGDPVATGAQITEALNYAIACGAPIQIGSILEGVIPPSREASDMTVAEVVKAQIRWTPDVSGWLDFSTTPPTIHLARRADLAAVTLPMVSDVSESLQIQARNDLVVPSVTIKYERTNTNDNGSWTSTDVDSYPDGASQQAVKALVQTLQLSGSRAAVQKQAVVTAGLPAAAASSSTIYNWFAKRQPWIKKLPSGAPLDPATALGMVSGSYYSAMSPTGQKAADGETDLDDGWTVADLPRELVSGSIAPWMEQTWPSLKTGKLVLGVALTFLGNLSAYSAQDQLFLTNTFHLNSSGPDKNICWLYEGVMATNAATQTYKAQTSFEAAEGTPTGIAQALYTALATLHYAGSFATVEAEISGAVAPGNTFNLTGGRAEWETMAAQVQEIEWDVAAGRTIVHFGPPEHLSPADMLDFLRAQRQTRAIAAPSERTSGAAVGSGIVDGAGKTPASGSLNPPGGGSGQLPYWHPFLIGDETGQNDTIPKASVDDNSDCFLASFSKLAISGLGSAFTVAAGNLIYARFTGMTVDSQVPTSATIMCNSGWSTHPAFDVFATDANGIKYQTDLYKIIAEVVGTDDPREGQVIGPAGNQVKILQRLRTSLLCSVENNAGILCLVLKEVAI